jgi:hypothetical protein
MFFVNKCNTFSALFEKRTSSNSINVTKTSQKTKSKHLLLAFQSSKELQKHNIDLEKFLQQMIVVLNID